MSAETEPMIRRTYTQARRYTQVVRWVMGYQLPVALQATQFVGGGASLVLLVQSRSAWGAALPSALQILIILVVPAGVMIALRYLRTDGTGPTAVALGLLTLATTPARGRGNGTTLTVRRAHRTPAAYSLVLAPAHPADDITATATPLPAAVRGGSDSATREHGLTTNPTALPGTTAPTGHDGTHPATALPGRRPDATSPRAARSLSVAQITAAAAAHAHHHADGAELTPAELGTIGQKVRTP